MGSAIGGRDGAIIGGAIGGAAGAAIGTTQNACLSTPDITLPAVSQHVAKDDYNIYFSADIGPLLSAIITTIKAHDDTLIYLRVERPSLEDRFLEITNAGVSR